MHIRIWLIPFLLIPVSAVFLSCQKEIDATVNGAVIPANQTPKLGTIWTYTYSTYYSYGSLQSTKTLVYKAKTEETFGGEKWLNIVDMDADTTVYLLNIKPGGLYQYANSNSNLFCKYPALLNDTYNTFHTGSSETFTVKGINDTLPTGIGDIPANYYEGFKGAYLIDLIWYNTNAWIVRNIVYKKLPSPATAYFRYSTMYINNIVY